MIMASNKSARKLKMLIQVAEELGFKITPLTKDDIEDIGLIIAMRNGRTGKYVSTKKVLKHLER
jgi:hypothetical protein